MPFVDWKETEYSVLFDVGLFWDAASILQRDWDSFREIVERSGGADNEPSEIINQMAAEAQRIGCSRGFSENNIRLFSKVYAALKAAEESDKGAL